MEIRNTLVMEVEKGGNTFRLLLPAGAGLGAAYDATHEFLIQLLEMSKEAAERAKPVEASAQVSE